MTTSTRTANAMPVNPIEFVLSGSAADNNAADVSLGPARQRSTARQNGFNPVSFVSFSRKGRSLGHLPPNRTTGQLIVASRLYDNNRYLRGRDTTRIDNNHTLCVFKSSGLSRASILFLRKIQLFVLNRNVRVGKKYWNYSLPEWFLFKNFKSVTNTPSFVCFRCRFYN